ncbi:outer membrane protein assembly factor BamE [Gammaproteobacteria bacterium]|jgi:outer membrane protein assembly factor BamE|nr:outer membrane protein assembly factor BamE [Gammaproteobacteria bacterium]
MKIIQLAIAALIIATITGCQILPEDAQLRSYRVLVQQGNLIEENKVDALKINMNKKQVIFLMGEPIVSNIFDKNRWDYVYYKKRDPEKTKLSIISIFFEEEKIIGMKRIVKNNDGLFDVQADGSEFPEFIEDKDAAAVKKEIFEDIELEGIKDDDILEEEFLTKSKIDDLKQKNIVKKDIQEEVIESKALDGVINISKPEDNKINNIGVKLDNEDKVSRKNDNDIVIDIIKDWSESWQSKNLSEYFSYYQEDFIPNSFNNNKLWVKDRSKKILGKSTIEIDIKDISIIFDINKEERAIVEFMQYYKSESYSDVVTKKIIFEKFGGQWKIVSEDIAQ